MKKKIPDIICALLIVLFVYASGSKLFNYNQFIMQLGHSPLIGSHAEILAWLIPTIELVVVILLTVYSTRFYGLLLALFLLIIFTGYIAGMLLSGSHLPCSCGGVISGLSWKEHLMFNLFFMALSLAGIVLEKKKSQGMPIKKSFITKNISRE
jgi:hypothetical protein